MLLLPQCWNKIHTAMFIRNAQNYSVRFAIMMKKKEEHMKLLFISAWREKQCTYVMSYDNNKINTIFDALHRRRNCQRAFCSSYLTTLSSTCVVIIMLIRLQLQMKAKLNVIWSRCAFNVYCGSVAYPSTHLAQWIIAVFCWCCYLIVVFHSVSCLSGQFHLCSAIQRTQTTKQDCNFYYS